MAARDNLEIAISPRFWRSNVMSCERVARGQLEIAILQFLAIEPHFVRKGSRDKRDDLKLQFYRSFLAIEPSFRAKRVARDDLKLQFYLSF